MTDCIILECSVFQLLDLGEFSGLFFCSSMFPFIFYLLFCVPEEFCGPFCIFFLPFKLIYLFLFLKNKDDIAILRIF